MDAPRRRSVTGLRRLAAPVIVALATVAGTAFTALHHDRTDPPARSATSPNSGTGSTSPGSTSSGSTAPSGPVQAMAPPGSGAPAGPTGSPEASSAAELTPPRSTLAFAEDFTGPAGAPADPQHWRAVTGGGGFGNDELECNTDDRRFSSLDGAGDLVITASYLPGYQCDDGNVNDYASARLSTSGLGSATYGKLRVRAKLPTASGVWPGIWALGQDNATAGWPWSGEIDVAEVVGTAPTTVYQTLHGPGTDNHAYAIDSMTDLGEPADAAFHVYGFDWAPDGIDFSVDGRITARFSRAQVEKHGTWVFDKPFFLLLDVAVGGTFPGPPKDPGAYPQRMVVDYVHLYR